MTILLLLFCQNTARAQGPQKIPGKPIICPAKFEDMHTRVNIASSTDSFNLRAVSAATAEIIVTYGPGAEANPEAKAAFQFALDIWSNQIVSSVPIKVFADFATLGAGVLASAGPSNFFRDVPNAPDPNVYYPAALANAIAGEVIDPDEEFDLIVNLGDGIPWYFGTDGNTPPGQFDFVTVALHEAGHGLGFTAIRDHDDTTGIGSLRFDGTPSVYGIFLVDGDDNRIIDFPDPSVQIGDAFTGGDLFVDGAFSNAALGGNRPEVYAPSTFQPGSSIAHWDEAAFPAGDPNSLMSPQVGSAESNHDIGDITRGHFKDMGWVINEAISLPIISNPSTLSEELFVDNSIIRTISISNVSNAIINASITSNEDSSTIEFFNPAQLTIPSTESASFNVSINTAGLTKGVYQDTIFIEAIDFDSKLSIPVTVRVLDGTEEPLISISPESFTENMQQFQVITRDLVIENTGDDDLTYSITTGDGLATNLASRVLTSNSAIKAQGFTNHKFPRNTEATNLTALVHDGINTYNKITTSLYSTNFEEFTIGDIDDQLGWSGRFEENWIVSNANAFEGSQHFRGISDGLGSTRDAVPLAFAPAITPGNEPFMVVSADINIQGSGVTWEVIPQSPSAGSVNTRLRFNPDGTIDALSNAGFVRLNATTPVGYFNLRIIIDKDDLALKIYFDDDLVFSGEGIVPLIEQVVFLSNMEVAGSTMDIDNFEVTDGDPNSFFLSVSPSIGTVPFGSSVTAQVKFDSRALVSGNYSANINVSSNDTANSSIDIPVSLTVLQPPTIEVTPEFLEASVNVQTDVPPTQTETFTISNSGESDLEFDSSLGEILFTSPSNLSVVPVESLDMAKYGKGNTGVFEEKSAGISQDLLKTKNNFYLNDAVTFSDSIAYDSGIVFPDDFSGVQTAAYTSAVNFDVETDFTLTAVRNGYSTTTVVDPVIILEIYKGGAIPNDGELLLTQTFNEAGANGIVVAEHLSEALSFSAGESFWVVHKYPDGIEFPQGVDATATQRPDTYFFSGDGGDTYSPSGFVFFVRALSGGADETNYITLEPSSGTVSPGQSLDVSVTFDGADMANGVYNTDILLSNNDPLNPTATVATSFEVSGQLSEIVISDEFLLFNDAFIGTEKERTFTIINSGLSQLNISSISSDNTDFTVDVSSATIAAKDSIAIPVKFAPTQLGSINGIITIESDADNAELLEVVVNGIGVDPPIIVVNPNEVSETTDAGTTIDSEITLTNEGNSPLLFSFPDLAAAVALAKEDVLLNNTEIIAFDKIKREKGFNDTRVGSPIEYSIGTDNGFGYTWIDSDEAGGPVYSFNDISATGTEITDGIGADGTAQVELSFPFEFYGIDNSSVLINANGFLTFQAPTSETYINDQIPIGDGINNIIAGLWADLEPQEFNGAVHFENFADKFIVQWTQATVFLGEENETVTFQIVLNANGNIDVYYEDVETASFLDTTTVGIENADATDGAQVAFNTDYIKDGLALHFVKPSVALTSLISNVTPLSGVVAAGRSRNLSVTLDATNLNDGTYYDELTVSSNDPIGTNNKALFELTVIGYPEIEVSLDSLQFEPIFVGLSSEASFTVQNSGSIALEITSISNENTDFVLDTEMPISLEPGESIIVDATFTPTSVGLIEDEITIVSNDTFGNENKIIYMSGVGVDPPIVSVSPNSLDLTVTKGKSITETISISNNGLSTLNYSLTPPFFARAGEANLEVSQYPKLEYAKITSKETLDTRVGPKFLNASGGPGTFGYTWIDNNSGGPDYEYIDISSTGQLIDVGGDGNATVSLPFDFNYFGNVENDITISANGYLTFSEITGVDYINSQIPDGSNPNLFIAALWSDLEPQNGDGVFYLATEEYFIVQYENVPGFGFPPFIPTPDPVSFQVILFPDGSIKMQYQNVNSTLSTSSTVGLEGPQGLSGLQVIFNTEFLTNELAITFTPPIRGTVEPGETVEVPVTFSTEGLEAEQSYPGSVVVSSNDPVNPEVLIPVNLEVVSGPEVVSFTLINALSNEEVGSLNEGMIIDLDEYDANSFSVLANIGTADVGSVVFDLNGVQTFHTENIAPYALNGDFSGGTEYNPVKFPVGLNTITATPYSGRNGSGEAGIPLTINFEVLKTNIPEIVSFTLINADTNEAIGSLNEGDVIDLSDYPQNSFSVVANIGDIPTASVVFDFNGVQNFQTENFAPYALKGDNISSNQYNSVELPSGANTITATPYYPNENGIREAGTSLIVNFEVINSDIPDEVEVIVFPNPVVDFTTVSLKGNESKLNGVIYDLSGNVVHKSIISLQNGKGEGNVDMSGLHRGIYILQLTNTKGEMISQVKVLKK